MLPLFSDPESPHLSSQDLILVSPNQAEWGVSCEKLWVSSSVAAVWATDSGPVCDAHISHTPFPRRLGYNKPHIYTFAFPNHEETPKSQYTLQSWPNQTQVVLMGKRENTRERLLDFSFSKALLRSPEAL